MSVQDTDRVLGPMQLLTVAFEDGADVEARIVREVDALQGRGVLRLLDVLVLRRNDDGSIRRLLLEDNELGELLSRVAPPEPAALFALVAADESGTRALAESLAPGGLLVFLLVEHRWARPLFDVIADAGGVLVDVGFMTDQAQTLVGAEITAFEDAAKEIEAAKATEAEAARRSLAALIAAEDTVAAARAIQTAAATDAVNALIVAGLIEAAAADEAAAVIAAAARDVDAAQQQAADAATAASVTPGELRVLRYLPTSMTFAVLAGKLGISRSAAKERAERAYKKLNVHNRRDAVTRARALGLIPKRESRGSVVDVPEHH
jgi:DNA-binding NarL/FixJ family response regulator